MCAGPVRGAAPRAERATPAVGGPPSAVGRRGGLGRFGIGYQAVGFELYDDWVEVKPWEVGP